MDKPKMFRVFIYKSHHIIDKLVYTKPKCGKNIKPYWCMCHDIKEVRSFDLSSFGQKRTPETFFKYINLCSAEVRK